MRFVQKDLNDIPDIFLKQSTLDDLEKIAANADVSLIKDDVYKDTYTDANGKTQSRVREKLNVYYLGKCAYCETFCKAEIEHYRPKKGVTGDKKHRGYYWLCYEWSNLVPSCRYCNTEGGKGNQFPVGGMRISKPVFKADGVIDKAHSLAAEATLLNEQPALLHPEIDYPKHFLTFRVGTEKKGIEIVGKDKTTKRGEKTVKICNLNRENLQIARLQNVVGYIVGSVNMMFDLLTKGTIAQDQLKAALTIAFKDMTKRSQDASLEHTLLRQTIAEDFKVFDALIVSQLATSQQKIVRKAFEVYLTTS
jgi:uncharacterized protein (TIGR02646 family)